MKNLVLILLAMSLVSCGNSNTDFDQPVEDFTEEEVNTEATDGETDEFVFSNEEASKANLYNL